MPENATPAFLISTLSVQGPGFVAPASFSITSDPSAKFEIVNGNEIRLKAGAVLDYEIATLHNLGLEAVDANLTIYTKNILIQVTNINEAPTDIILSASSIPENILAGSIIGALSTIDPDAGDSHTYSIDLDADSKFAVSGGNLIVRAGASFDFETKTSHSVTIRSTDAGGLFTTKIFTIQITNVNEAPTDITIASGSLSVADNTAAGTPVVTFATVDPDAGDTFTYSLQTLSSDFEVAGNALKVKAGAALVAGTVALVIRTTDAGGLTLDKSFTVTVTAAASFLPTDLTVMPDWYRGKVGVTVGTGVQNWADQGTNGNDLTQLTGAKQPAYDAVNGILSFDGIDDFLENTAMPMSGTDVHVFLVAALISPSTNKRFISHKSGTDWNVSSAPVLLKKPSGTSTAVDSYANAQVAVTATGVVDGVLKLIHSEVVGGIANITVSGVVGTSIGSVATPLTGAGLSVGTGSNGYGQMDVKEIVYVRGAMTAQEITDTETYLKTEHGL